MSKVEREDRTDRTDRVDRADRSAAPLGKDPHDWNFPTVMSPPSSGALSAPVSTLSSPMLSPLKPPLATIANGATPVPLVYGYGDSSKSLDFLHRAPHIHHSESQKVTLRPLPMPNLNGQTQTPPLSPTLRPSSPETPRNDGAESDPEIRDSSEPGSPSRPGLLRKKSGELVKSSLKLPLLTRTRSMPNTKNVHFDVNLVHVRRFNRKERPEAVSIGLEFASDEDDDSDEEEDQWIMTTPSFAVANYAGVEGQDRPIVYLDNLYLSADNKSLRGNVLVRNVSFSKHVAVRYTVDFWKNMSETEATFNTDIRKRDKNAGYDRFTFEVPFASIADQRATNSLSMFLAVRYRVDKTEYWDNNHNLNYEVLFRKGGSDRWLNTPTQYSSETRNKKSTRSYSVDDVNIDNMSTHDDWDFGYELTRTPSEIFASVAAETQAAKPRHSSANSNPSSLKTRYSFGAAFNSPPKSSTRSQTASTEKAPTERVFPKSPGLAPMDSASYQDIISKYCFFTPVVSGSGAHGLKGHGAVHSMNHHHHHTRGSSDSPSPPPALVDISDRKHSL